MAAAAAAWLFDYNLAKAVASRERHIAIEFLIVSCFLGRHTDGQTDWQTEDGQID